MKKLRNQILSVHGARGQEWLDNLPTLVQRISEKWDLANLIAFENLSWNYVAKARKNDQKVVLKVSCDLLSLEREVSALRAFTPGSCVEVIEFDPSLKATLLEAAIPGTDLMRHPPSEQFEVLRICCDVASNLTANQNPNRGEFKPIVAEFEKLDLDWNLPEGFLHTARKLKKELVSGQTADRVIHGDLHRENILLNHGKWVAIDPKSYLGNLYNEVWPFIHEPETEIPWVANRLSLNEEYLFKWCYLHSILATTWCLEDGVDSTNIFGLARKIHASLKF